MGLNRNCKTCDGEGILYYIKSRRVDKEEYREYFNGSTLDEFENSTDYCRRCNRFIKYSDESPEEGLCDNCYMYKQLEDEDEKKEKELDNKAELKTKFENELLEEILKKNMNKEELKKWGNEMTFIEFDDFIIHLDNIIKVKKEKHANYFSEEKETTHSISIFTRDGETHRLDFKDINLCDEKYKKIQDIIKENGKMHTI